MSQNPHPARSPEFLSRLHDQELSPAERAHFESHRAHCSECRNAASEFEAALALFRSTGPRPASPDLSARILRKLQQSEMTSRRRLHFGPSFGIDLRWAGAFAAAVIAVIVASSVVVRNESQQTSVLLKVPASASAPGSVEEPAKSDAPAAKERLGDQTAAAAGEREGAKKEVSSASSDALAAKPQPAAENPPGLFGYDKDQKAAAPSGSPAEALTKQKEAGKLTARTAPEVLAPQAPNGRFAERDTREESAAANADRGQVAMQSQNQAPELRAAQENRSSQDERKRAAPARQQAAKSEVIARNDASDSQNQNQNQNQNAIQNRNVASNSNSNYAQAPPPPAAAPAPAAAGPRDAERAGGEGGTTLNFSTVDGASAANVRLVVAPLDDAGAAPDVVPLTAGDVPLSLKGQEFVVIVDMAGRVQQVTPRRKDPSEARRNGEKRLKKATPPPSPLTSLRFQPGARQRRLLVRVE